jgi:RNA polymerase-binding transcription factor DksA
MRAIEDALTRFRHDKLGICAECGQPIRKARLEAVPGPGGVETARSSRTLKAETQPFAAIRADILVSIWCLFL